MDWKDPTSKQPQWHQDGTASNQTTDKAAETMNSDHFWRNSDAKLTKGPLKLVTPRFEPVIERGRAGDLSFGSNRPRVLARSHCQTSSPDNMEIDIDCKQRFGWWLQKWTKQCNGARGTAGDVARQLLIGLPEHSGHPKMIASLKLELMGADI